MWKRASWRYQPSHGDADSSAVPGSSGVILPAALEQLEQLADSRGAESYWEESHRDTRYAWPQLLLRLRLLRTGWPILAGIFVATANPRLPTRETRGPFGNHYYSV